MYSVWLVIICSVVSLPQNRLLPYFYPVYLPKIGEARVTQ